MALGGIGSGLWPRGAHKGKIEDLIDGVLRPLIEADGGSLELVSAGKKRVVLSLGGAFAGCPGTPFVVRDLIEPLVHQALGQEVEVQVLTAIFNHPS